MKTANYELYVLKSLRDHNFYAGYSSDPDRRLLYHNSGKCSYTREGQPWEIVYRQKFSSKREAIQVIKFLNDLSWVEMDQLLSGVRQKVKVFQTLR